ncbi:MAG TPA: hypothetical protein VF595_17575 [Tepidisphaeraceae bacterium]|jgi:hypothetical protein
MRIRRWHAVGLVLLLSSCGSPTRSVTAVGPGVSVDAVEPVPSAGLVDSDCVRSRVLDFTDTSYAAGRPGGRPVFHRVRPGPTWVAAHYVSHHPFAPVDSSPKYVSFFALPGHTYAWEPVMPLQLRIAYLAREDYELRLIDLDTGEAVAQTNDALPPTQTVPTIRPRLPLVRRDKWAMVTPPCDAH